VNAQNYPLWLGYTDMPRFLQDPITMVNANGIVLTDSRGKEYVDLESGIRNVLLGYSQPEIVEAVRMQLQALPYARGAHFGNAAALSLALKLADLSPVKRPRILFHNSGSESVEAAVKIVRQLAFLRRDGRSSIITLNKGYHGQTVTALSASGESYSKEPFEPLTEGFVFVDVPTSVHDADQILSILRENPCIGAVMIEPILGNGGVITIPEEYLLQVRKICDEHGLLLICDEVTTGFGRCGKWFLSENYPPDILIVGKAITNGYLPLSATIVAEPIWQTFDQQGYFRHGQTNLNHPACCAAGLATLEILSRMNAPEACQRKGQEIREAFQALMMSGKVLELRGCGLLWAIVFDGEIHRRHSPSKWLQLLLLEEGFIVGQIENTVFLSPAVITESSHVQRFIECLQKALT
jgi:adenosylmethionine-8-amino-7-oxononanoate aminotransferase